MRHIIYLPGLGEAFQDESLFTFAGRFAKTLDINDPSAPPRYRTKCSTIVVGVHKEEIAVADILEERNGEAGTVARIYGYDYRSKLIATVQKRSVAVQCIMLVGALVMKLPRLLRVLFMRSRNVALSRGDSGQAFYSALILIMLGGFGLVLMVALFGSFEQILVKAFEPQDLPLRILRTFLKGIGPVYWLYQHAQWFTSLCAALFLLLPQWKASISQLGMEFLSLAYYFQNGAQKLEMAGGFETVIEHIAEEGEPDAKVDVVAYSFGSLLMLDVLFPRSGTVALRIAQRLGKFITIGCPFDFVKTYWPEYYEGRKESPVQPTTWVNIHSKLDVLSSNFRMDDKDGPGTMHVAQNAILPRNVRYDGENIETVSWVQYALLIGLSSHGSAYWDNTPDSSSCLNAVIEELR